MLIFCLFPFLDSDDEGPKVMAINKCLEEVDESKYLSYIKFVSTELF